jgi:hypothetical protein
MKIPRLTRFILAAAALVLQAGAAQAAMKTRWIDYQQGTTALSGYLIYDDALPGRRPGVLMIHDRSGFSENTLADAQMIAKLGYVVFAEDIFGKGVVPKDVPEMTKLITIYNNDRPLMRARAQAGFEVLKAQPMVDPAKLASVGYCFGGTVAYEISHQLHAQGEQVSHSAHQPGCGPRGRFRCHRPRQPASHSLQRVGRESGSRSRYRCIWRRS